MYIVNFCFISCYKTAVLVRPDVWLMLECVTNYWWFDAGRSVCGVMHIINLLSQLSRAVLV